MISRDHTTSERPGRRSASPVTGWGTAIRLAVVVSITAALLVAAFAGRVAASTLICAVLAVSSVVGWISAEHAPTPTPLRLRRR